MQGVIMGFGSMGQTHYERYVQLGARIAAVVETDSSKTALALTKRLPVFSSLSEIPFINAIDFIDICTPTYLHYPHIQEAMSFQKAIFVEKPLVRTPTEATALRLITYPYPVFVGEVEQYNPTLKPFLEQERTPKSIKILRRADLNFFLKEATWFLNENLSGGIIFDLMIHDIHLLLAKYGKPSSVKKVIASSKKFKCIDKVEATLAYNYFDAAIIADWTASQTKSPITTIIKIITSDGNKIRWVCDDYLIRKTSPIDDAFYLELKAFLESIQTRKTPYPLFLYLDAIEIAWNIRRQSQVSDPY